MYIKTLSDPNAPIEILEDIIIKELELIKNTPYYLVDLHLMISLLFRNYKAPDYLKLYLYYSL